MMILSICNQVMGVAEFTIPEWIEAVQRDGAVFRDYAKLLGPKIFVAVRNLNYDVTVKTPFFAMPFESRFKKIWTWCARALQFQVGLPVQLLNRVRSGQDPRTPNNNTNNLPGNTNTTTYFPKIPVPEHLLFTPQQHSYTISLYVLTFKSIIQNPMHPLKDCTFYFKPGDMTLVLGSSSSGKDPLFRILGNRLHDGKATGNITYNNKPVKPKDFHHLTSFIGRNDNGIHVRTWFFSPPQNT